MRFPSRAGRDRLTSEVQPAPVLRLDRVQAVSIREVGAAGVGHAVALDRLQPAQRTLQKGQRRHEVRRDPMCEGV
jgi:hypothetical protein